MPLAKWGELKGVKEARETLQSLDRRVQTKVGKRALKAPGAVFVRSIRAKAPVSRRASDPTPGSLRDSVKLGKSRSRKGQARQEIVIDDVAAVPNQYGTSKMKGNAFASRGVDAAREEAAQAMAKAVQSEVDAEVAAIARRGK